MKRAIKSFVVTRAKPERPVNGAELLKKLRVPRCRLARLDARVREGFYDVAIGWG
jgi:hypothetical protein